MKKFKEILQMVKDGKTLDVCLELRWIIKEIAHEAKKDKAKYPEYSSYPVFFPEPVLQLDRVENGSLLNAFVHYIAQGIKYAALKI